MQTLRIGFVTLTGASRERGEIIRRFNEDRNCRVFLGSLKAGGTGIDLIGGSTVLHYDRISQPSRSTSASRANISALLKDKKLATGAPLMRQRRPLT